MVEYEWKPWAYDTCKVFGNSCKALVPNLLVDDILKIQNGSDALYPYSSLVVKFW
jgi:hypothetical protein